MRHVLKTGAPLAACIIGILLLPSCTPVMPVSLIAHTLIQAEGDAETARDIAKIYTFDARMTTWEAEQAVGVTYEKLGIALTEREEDRGVVLLSGATPAREAVWVRITPLDRGFVRFEVQPGRVAIFNGIQGTVQSAVHARAMRVSGGMR